MPSKLWHCIAVLLLILGSGLYAAETENPQPSKKTGAPVEVQMRNVMYHFTDSIVVHIRRLRGQLISAGELPVFDDKESFKIQVAFAEIAISPESLSSLLNSYTFAKPDAPLKDVSVHIKDGKLTMKGKLHNKGDVSFETEGTLSATPDGKLLVHTEKVRALHLPVKGLMDLLGVDIDDLIKSGKLRGIQVQKDDLILDPETLLPAPHVAGPVTAVRLEPNNIVQIIGRAGDVKEMHVPAANYMAYSGNQLRFGKLTMSDTDLVLIDMDPKDPFDFYLDHYKEQLVAGYTKQTMDFGLRVFMRDYNKLRQSSSAHPAKTKP